MKLQKRIAIGIAFVLLTIIIFLGFSLRAFWHINRFTEQLPRDIKIAQTYERLADNLLEVTDQAELYENVYNPPTSVLTTKRIDKLINSLHMLDKLVSSNDRAQKVSSISHLCSSYLEKVRNYRVSVSKRNLMLQRKMIKREGAAAKLWQNVTSLSHRFNSMMSDFKAALKAPEFRISLKRTSTLLMKVSRIEKDLAVAEVGVSLYLSLRFNKEKQITPTSQRAREASRRVEQRLDAILFLLDKSVAETTNQLHRRVLTKIKIKIVDFLSSFRQLRGILNAPEHELLEIGDEIHSLLVSIMNQSKIIIVEAQKEANIYWAKIYETSEQIRFRTYQSRNILLVFSLIVAFFGFYVVRVVPQKITGPLEKLNAEINSFKFGNSLEDTQTFEIPEIDALSEAFQLMAKRLQEQAKTTKNYMELIHNFSDTFRELNQAQRGAIKSKELLEKAINTILQQLVLKCPIISLVKVMVVRGDNLVRVGDPVFNDSFRISDEYNAYCKSVDWDIVSETSKFDEIIPIGSGITGWLYENSSPIRAETEAIDFFSPVYDPPAICENKILDNRQYEKGLEGSILTEDLAIPNQDFLDNEGNHGMLFVYFKDPNQYLSWQEIFFIKIIASQISSIIETDGLLNQRDKKNEMESQLTMAKEIQENLLPQNIPEMAGLTMTKISKSAAEVGGDYYDFFKLGEHKMGIVIADASGKNVPAAIIMTVFKTALSTMKLEIMSAEEVMSLLNKIISNNITNDRFITAMYIIVNTESGDVELASAGHNPAMIATGHGSDLHVIEKNVKCVPLGILDDYEFTSTQFKLHEDDLLLLYTDGVTEARDYEGKEFGEQKLKKFMAKRVRTGNIAQSLLQEVESFSMHARQHDDITAVAIHFKGERT